MNTLSNLAGKKPEEYTLTVRKLSEPRAGASDPAARIEDMDTDGLDAEVLYVGGPLQSKDPALRLNSVRGYNRWLSDYASYAPGRLLGMAAIPIDTPERAAEEVRFAAAQVGLAGGYIPLFPPEGDYGDAKWESHAEEHGAHGEFKPHESPVSMLFPLVVLAGLSTVGGVIQLPTYNFIPEDWQNKLGEWLHPVVEFGETREDQDWGPHASRA